MNNKHDNLVSCSQFEELLTDYLDKTLDAPVHKAVASHALSCPLCHSLLNDVKESLHVCREISAPAMPMTQLEARILSMTTPETSMACDDFESHLTDYLDGFLPATAFHRWERHAALCSSCEDMPGMVVRSIAACYTYKTDELAVPAGLHERILQLTIGTAEAAAVKASLKARVGEWVRGLSFPVAIPQLAPVAMMIIFAFMIFSQTVSADGSLSGVYQKSFELAEQTYKQGADAINGKTVSTESQAPASETSTVAGEDNK
jgi:anti-sigma factor RsiW